MRLTMLHHTSLPLVEDQGIGPFCYYWFIVVIIIYCTWIHLYKEILHMHNTRRAGWRDGVWNNNFSKSREGAQLAVIAMLLNRLLQRILSS